MMEMILFQLQVFTLHAHNTCGGKSVCHLLVVPTVDYDSKLCCHVNKEQRTIL